jgi:hypothetical protein
MIPFLPPLRPSGMSVQVAMSIGSKVACVLDLVDCSVSHVFYTRSDPAQPAQEEALPRHRPVWISSGNRTPIIGLCGTDWGEGGITLLKVANNPDHGSGISVMKHEQFQVPGRVSALSAHPSDPSLCLGMRVSQHHHFSSRSAFSSCCHCVHALFLSLQACLVWL